MSGAKTRLAYLVALWFGCGLSPIAPGTCGTLGALPLYLLVRPRGPLAILAAAAAVTAIGIWAADVVAARERAKDPQMIVVDEVAGVLIALAAAPPTLGGAAAAVVLFRVFDITKPFPARAAEHLPGGVGVVLDDVVAGAWAAAALFALRAAGVVG